jgi:hypothetical protein
MAAQSERVLPDADQDEVRPIELLTENGFSIFRLWEIEAAPIPTAGSYEFLVRKADGIERKLLVEIAHEVVSQIEIHTRGRILLSNSFWIWCAERHLAIHLWEYDECPGDGKLRIEVLTPADFNLSIRWERT